MNIAGGAKNNLIQKITNPARKGVMGNHNTIQTAVLKGLGIASPAQATTDSTYEQQHYYFGHKSYNNSRW